MVLNGPGFSHRQGYLVPQKFAEKPVKHRLGEDISADLLHEDGLGRAVDGMVAPDPTSFCAERARQA
jgi:hypothetical protein